MAPDQGYCGEGHGAPAPPELAGVPRALLRPGSRTGGCPSQRAFCGDQTAAGLGRVPRIGTLGAGVELLLGRLPAGGDRGPAGGGLVPNGQ
jgi:hypothetical protein